MRINANGIPGVTQEKNRQEEQQPKIDAEMLKNLMAGHGNATLPNDPIYLRNWPNSF